MTAADFLLWVALPYVTIAIFLVGMFWRYRYDKFGWTTRSSQLYERKLIRIASPLFHIGILAVVGGHVIGLLIPESWTHALGLSETAYHVIAVGLGLVAGICTLVGIALLIYRRRTVGPVFSATTNNDKFMYIFLVAAILLGLLTTFLAAGFIDHSYNYRDTVSVWFRSIFLLNPQPELMAEAPLYFRVHAVAGLLVFIIWPFTRLVHAFSAPLLYAFRPYVIYRDRGQHDPGSREARRGWEKVGTPDNKS
jgi:nitrate reductase gamma subunit